MSNDENNSRVTSSLITAFAMIVVAIIGIYGIKIQTEVPMRATLTAQPPKIIVTKIFVTKIIATAAQPKIVVTVKPPQFTLKNKLFLPISVYIDGEYVGEVKRESSKVFILDSYPVEVKWEVVKIKTTDNRPVGDDMGSYFEDVTDNETLTVDNIYGDNTHFFYPIITNNTNKSCFVTVNDTWEYEFDTKAVVPAYEQNNGFGYYRLFTNSNVSLSCEGKLFWWGKRSDDDSGTEFYEKIETGSGAIYFTHNQ